MNPILTIIVPAFRVEPYIGECIRSIYRCAAAHPDSIEVLVIDDGSPDRSADIVSELQTTFPSLRLIRQENQGLSGARNTGVRNARGQYVWFVDSDDTLTGQWDTILLPLLEPGTLQAVAICASDAPPQGGDPVRRFSFDGLDASTSGKAMLALGRFSFCAPFTIYRRDFLIDNGLTFTDGLYHEDMDFTPRAYCYVERMALVNEPFYVVRNTPGSITRSVNFKKNFDLLTIATRLDRFLPKVKDADVRRSFSNTIALLLNSALRNSSEMNPATRTRLRRELAANRHLFQHYQRSRKPQYVVQGLIFRLVPANPEWTYNHIQKLLS